MRTFRLKEASKTSDSSCFSVTTKINVLTTTIGFKNLHQSEVNRKPIGIRLQTFYRALRQLNAFTSSFKWLTVLSLSFVISFKTLN